MLRRLALAAFVAGCTAPLDTANVDTTQMAGQWFEVAHLPRSTQDGCSNTTATYLPLAQDGHFSVTHQCTLPSGSLNVSNATLYVLDKSQTGKLGIDLGGFIGDYWVLEVPSDYHYMVVGHPSRSYWWLLSRTKQLPQGDMEGILSRAQAAGFDTSQLIYTPQN